LLHDVKDEDVELVFGNLPDHLELKFDDLNAKF
jgi:hypothetical protein